MQFFKYQSKSSVLATLMKVSADLLFLSTKWPKYMAVRTYVVEVHG